VVESPNVVENPDEYLKLNKLLRATNELTRPSESELRKHNKFLVFTPEQRFIILLNMATIFVTYIYFTEIPISIAFGIYLLNF
jgi:hypothetical protein